MLTLRTVLVALLLVLSLPSFADAIAGHKNKMMQAYKAYGAAFNAGNLDQAEQHIVEAYQYSATAYGQPAQPAAAVAHAYADFWIYNKDPKEIEWEAVEEALNQTIEIYQDVYGDDSNKLVWPLMSLAYTYTTRHFIFKKRSTVKKLISRAVELSSEAEKTEVRFTGASQMIDRGYNNRFPRDLLLDALESEGVEKSPYYGVIHLYLGKVFLGAKDYEDSRKYLTIAVNEFSKNENLIDYELSARAFLVEVLERDGLQSEANQHCQIIAKKAPWEGEGEADKIFETIAEYPKKRLKTGTEGYAIVEFDINKFGVTKNIKVVEESAMGFGGAAMKAVEGSRYKPRYENGGLVYTEKARKKITFQIAK